MVTEEELKNMSPEEIAELQKQNCIFCKIIKGEVPSTKVYEDDKLIAILDINPAQKGHILVMPKEHFPVLPAIPPELQSHLFKTSKYLMKGVRQGGVTTAVSLFIANGAVAGQQSPHFLFHIIPRENNDGLFALPTKTFEDAQTITPALKKNVSAIISQYLRQIGKPVPEHQPPIPPPQEIPSESPTQPHPVPEQQTPTVPEPPSQVDKTADKPIVQSHKDDLALAIQSNPDLKKMIIKNPAGIKELVAQDETFARLFAGVDIDKLSRKLRQLEKKDEPQKEYEPNRNLDKVAGLFTR